jgi:outer membrane protein assembly factor BamB
MTGRSRRSVLGALATGASTALAGCGYRPGLGERAWREPTTADAAYLVGDAVALVDHVAPGPERSVIEERGEVRFLDASSGDERGSGFINVTFGASAPGDRGVFAAGSRSNVSAFDADGDVRWATVPEGGIVVDLASHDGLLGATTSTGYLYALDAGSGERRFRTQFVDRSGEGDGDASVAVGAGAGGFAVASRDDGWRVAGYDRRGGRRWTREVASSTVTSPRVRDGRAYVRTADRLLGFDVRTGDLTLELPLRLRRPLRFADDGRFAYATALQEVVAVDVDAGAVAWRHRVGGDGDVSEASVPAPGGGSVFVHSRRGLVELDARTGAVRERATGVQYGESVGATPDVLVAIEDDDGAAAVARRH